MTCWLTRMCHEEASEIGRRDRDRTLTMVEEGCMLRILTFAAQMRGDEVAK